MNQKYLIKTNFTHRIRRRFSFAGFNLALLRSNESLNEIGIHFELKLVAISNSRK